MSWILYSLAKNDIISNVVGKATLFLIWNFDKWCVNLAISTLVAYLLWYFKLWGAGDAKLFITYSALIPMGQYSKVYFNYIFASFFLLLNIFLPATIFLFLKAIFYVIKRFNFRGILKSLKKLSKEILTLKKLIESLKVLLGFFIFFLFFVIINQEFYSIINKIILNQNFLILISLLIFKPLSKFFLKKSKLLVLIFVILFVYYVFKPNSSPLQNLSILVSSVVRSLSVMFIFPLVNMIFSLYEQNTVHKTMPFAPWMFLGTLIIWFF